MNFNCPSSYCPNTHKNEQVKRLNLCGSMALTLRCGYDKSVKTGHLTVQLIPGGVFMKFDDYMNMLGEVCKQLGDGFNIGLDGSSICIIKDLGQGYYMRLNDVELEDRGIQATLFLVAPNDIGIAISSMCYNASTLRLLQMIMETDPAFAFQHYMNKYDDIDDSWLDIDDDDNWDDDDL